MAGESTQSYTSSQLALLFPYDELRSPVNRHTIQKEKRRDVDQVRVVGLKEEGGSGLQLARCDGNIEYLHNFTQKSRMSSLYMEEDAEEKQE